YPSQRIKFMLADADISVVVTQAEHQEKISTLDVESQTVHWVEIDTFMTVSYPPIADITYQGNAEDIAYLIYTSGTTGQPKGVLIPHRGISRLVKADNVVNFQADDKVVQLTSLVFDIAMFEIWGSLLSGTVLHILAKEMPQDIYQLAEILQHDSSMLCMTATVFKEVINATPYAFDQLRMLIFVGEAVSVDCAKELLARKEVQNLNITMINGYGPTENSIFSIYYEATSADDTACYVPIGQPLAQTQTYVVDKYQQLLPLGLLGELCLGGAGVAHGYLKRPQLNKTSFIGNPFHPERSLTLYRTGDQCHWLPDGHLMFIGRSDSQVKVRGVRVELSEIEHQLLTHMSISQATVLMYDKMLIAYVVARSETVIDIAAVKQYLQQRLYTYMIPSQIIVLDKLPVSINGKINKAHLPPPDTATLATGQAPQGTIEKQLANIWQRVFNRQAIGRTDDYFRLGGDSIIAMQIATLARQAGLGIKPSDILTHTTLADLSPWVQSMDTEQPETHKSTNNPVALTPMVKRSTLEDFPLAALTQAQLDKIITNYPQTEDIYPLSSLQQGLLFHALQTTAGHNYTIQLQWTHQGMLDKSAIQQAWQTLIQRHTALRTVIYCKTDEPMQIVLRPTDFACQWHDFRAVPAKKQQARFNTFLDLDSKTGFNFTQLPILRVNVFCFSETVYRITVTYHHIFIDGWSFSILLTELKQLYQSFICGQEAKLAPAPQFSRYIAWLKQQDVTEIQGYWQNYLSDFTNYHAFPLLTTSASNNTERMDQFDLFPLSDLLSKQLRQCTKKHGLTLNTISQGLWALLLSHYQQADEVIFGITMAARQNEVTDIDKMVGLLIDTVPLRVKLNDTKSLYDYLHQIQTDMLKSTHHQTTSLPAIQRWLDLPAKQALFDHILVFENYPMNDMSEEAFSFNNIEFGGNTHYPLTIIIIPGEIITLKFEYDMRRLTSEAVHAIAQHLQTLLTQAVAKMHLNLKANSPLSQVERQQLGVQWGRGAITEAGDISIPQLFSEQVIQHQHDIALVYEDQKFTYQQLNDQANQLANILRQKQHQPNQIVAVFMQRSAEIIVSLLAVLKAGSAFLNVDPEYPDERIKDILQDSLTRIIITKSNYDDRLQSLSANIAIDHLITMDSNDIIKAPTSFSARLQLTPEHLAYIIYTSGSTGKPKGIMQTHRTITNLIRWQSDCAHQGERITQFTNLSFDVSVQEIFYALLNGYQLHIVPTAIKQSIHRTLSFLAQNKINMLFLPTALLNLFAEEALRCQPALVALTTIIVAGEALRITPAIRQFFTKYAHISLINHYGPAETHVVTYYPLTSAPGQWPEAVPIGQPVANTHCYVLDTTLKPTAIGVPGDLYIGGAGLAQAYLNNDTLTQIKFIAHPENTKQRLYKTGDKAHWSAEGHLIYLGRGEDRQVKIRGFRVELAEIENHIQQFSETLSAIVLAKKDQLGKLCLIAYVVDSGGECTQQSLRFFMAHRLPAYMVPTTFVFLAQFPITKNGKIDYIGLPEPDRRQLTSASEYIAPRTELEAQIATIWLQILAIKRVRVEDDFFELGGHSLLALQMLAQIHQQFSVDLAVDTLLRAPTIAQLASVIGHAKQDEKTLTGAILTSQNNAIDSALIPFQESGRKSPVFLVHPIGGTVFWYLSLSKYMNPDQPFYGIQDPGVSTSSIDFQSIEALASFYIKAIRSVQAQGPYLLGGASAGGTIATEMARQLQAQGEHIAWLGLFDSWVSYPEALTHHRELFALQMQRQYNTLRDKFTDYKIHGFDALIKLQWQRVQILKRYRQTKINGPLTLFKAQTVTPLFQAIDVPYNNWDQYTDRPIECYSVPGDHESMFYKPNVYELAQQFNQILEHVA
ncbi:MAG: amino acid adenylation domain-containing protein, partial [Gammaproteobacteria bacterium]